jgi:hypothetical protein
MDYKLYTELLSEELNLDLICDAYEGRGSNSIILNFAVTEFEENSIVIIQLTFPNRIELVKQYNKKSKNENKISYPLSFATLDHYNDDPDITFEHKKTYIDFVSTYYDILTFNDIFFVTKIIKEKKIKYPSCKFILITPHLVKQNLFDKNIELLDYISYDGFFYDFENWDLYGKLVNEKKYINDLHLSKNGNIEFYKKLLKIIKNE